MSNDKEPASLSQEESAIRPRDEKAPLESEVARGNVHSTQHEEPDTPTPPPHPH
jgi:hypothetical protein